MADFYVAAKIRKFVFSKALRIFAAKKIRNLRRKSRRISRLFFFVVTAIVIDIYFRLYTLLQFDLCTRVRYVDELKDKIDKHSLKTGELLRNNEA